MKNGTGYIKELDYDGYVIYEGEYINGKRNGKGKEYNNEIIFDGICFNNYKRKEKNIWKVN